MCQRECNVVHRSCRYMCICWEYKAERRAPKDARWVRKEGNCCHIIVTAPCSVRGTPNIFPFLLSVCLLVFERVFLFMYAQKLVWHDRKFRQQLKTPRVMQSGKIKREWKHTKSVSLRALSSRTAGTVSSACRRQIKPTKQISLHQGACARTAAHVCPELSLPAFQTVPRDLIIVTLDMYVENGLDTMAKALRLPPAMPIYPTL